MKTNKTPSYFATSAVSDYNIILTGGAVYIKTEEFTGM